MLNFPIYVGTLFLYFFPALVAKIQDDVITYANTRLNTLTKHILTMDVFSKCPKAIWMSGFIAKETNALLTSLFNTKDNLGGLTFIRFSYFFHRDGIHNTLIHLYLAIWNGQMYWMVQALK